MALEDGSQGYLPTDDIYLIACHECKTNAGKAVYDMIQEQIFHDISNYASFPGFNFDPEHDHIKFTETDEGISAKIQRSAPHCNAMFGPAFDTEAIHQNGLIFYCEYMAKKGNIATAVLPISYNENQYLNSYYSAVTYPSNATYIYQNGWSKGMDTPGRGKMKCVYSQFLQFNQKALLKVDFRNWRLSVINKDMDDYTISVEIPKSYRWMHVSFEVGNAPSEIIIMNHWWAKS